MQILLDVTAPIFMVIGGGYLAVYFGVLSASASESIMKFAQQIAIPCLLFLAIWRLDLANDVNWRLLISFYGGSAVCFLMGLFGARLIFRRSWEDAVAIGFTAQFGNTVLLGLAVIGRAYDEQALATSYTIVAFHAIFCYLTGIISMELLRERSSNDGTIFRQILNSLVTNALLIGMILGLIFNLLGIMLPRFMVDSMELLAKSGIPVALFSLGGILTKYRPEGNLGLVFMVCIISLIIHPALTWFMAVEVFSLRQAFQQSAVITAAMAPGVNAYLFASIYNRAKRIAATSVLLGTVASVFTASLWINIIG